MDIDFARIEKKWQDRWADEKAFEVSDSVKNPYYVLEMFPYPSGAGLHMGHTLNYTIGDIVARFKIMKGFDVMHPMGYDALGLPAENAAIIAGEHPEEYTRDSIKNFVKQTKALGATYDWSRVINTATSEYYKWDQWIFLKMLETPVRYQGSNGAERLAYQKEASVNWCSKCNTVLANEQVNEGKCWRHEETEVEVRKLRQWFFKMTEYADELLSGLDDLDWPERTKKMQRNWIGKSEGLVEFWDVDGMDLKLETFTTWPHTTFGVTFMAMAPAHPLVGELVKGTEYEKEAKKFIKKIERQKLETRDLKDKEGFFTGRYVINFATKKKIPIYLANFAVIDYGSGIVKCCPAHDQRDFEFAKEYDLEITSVIKPKGGKEIKVEDMKRAYHNEGVMINADQFTDMETPKAKQEFSKWAIKIGKARKKTQYKLRDWGISRQRYWGTPIPIVYCDDCGVVPVPEKDLPVELPKDVKFGEGNPLEGAEDWLNVKCPKCGGKGRRESDTMDTFVNSSWYFLRYCDPNNSKKIFDSKKVGKWCPVDMYVGGAEHACMHLLYARFYTKFLRDIGLIDFDEPFMKLFHQGMLHAEDGRKMSKSLGNVVDPLECFGKHGVDATRWFLVSVASPDKDFDWSEKGILGATRFVKKVCGFFEEYSEGKDSYELVSKLNLTIKNVGEYYDSFEYRKATIEIRELFDLISSKDDPAGPDKGCSKESAMKFLKLISPVCPHIAEEMWEKIGGKGFVSKSDWPEFDEKKILEKGEGEDLNGKIVERILGIVKDDTMRVYVYVMPFEIGRVDVKKIGKEVGKDVLIYSVSDKDKFDPKGMAKKAKPGMAAIYLE